LLFSETLSIFFLKLANTVLDIFWFLIEPMADWGAWQMAAPPILAWFMALLGIGYWLFGRGLPFRYFGLIAAAVLFLYEVDSVPIGEVRLTQLDVGQGLATVVETKNHVLVFDAGPRYGQFFDTGQAVVVPFLKQQGYAKVDLMMISHGDNDHRGGAKSIAEMLRVMRVLSGEPEKIEFTQAEKCLVGQSWFWDEVKFTTLWPATASTQKGNNASCVLKIETKNKSVLLTGDIEAIVEKQLLQHFPDELNSDVLVVPHHGSLSSSTESFIGTVSPDVAIFSSGYRNRYGFPKLQIRTRYLQQNIALLNTAKSGAITLESNQQHWEISLYRDSARRYWHTK
jgi:competence protein ComEC